MDIVFVASYITACVYSSHVYPHSDPDPLHGGVHNLMLYFPFSQGVIIIDDVFPEGNACRDGRLCIGDRILEINDEDFSNRTLAEATLALSAVVPLMKLVILREYFEEGESDSL